MDCLYHLLELDGQDGLGEFDHYGVTFSGRDNAMV